MKRIPISVAEMVAKNYGYDQIIILGRKVGESPRPHGEHMTTYGINKEHCKAAEHIGTKLQLMMGWNAKRG